MPKPDLEETYTEAETEVRREAILKRVLATPPNPQEAMRKKRVESQSK